MIQYVHPKEVFQLDIEAYQANRNKIGNITNAYNRNMTLRLGQLTEFSFSVPYKVQKNGKMVRNPEIDKIKSPFHYKITLNGVSEWFMVSTMNSNGVDKNYMDVNLKSLGYQLARRPIRSWAGVYIDNEYRKDSLSPQQVLDNVLSATVWSIGTIDGELLTKYRSFDFSNTTRLDAIYDIAAKFGAIVEWNTINKTVSLRLQENVGIDTGLRIHYGKYLKSLSKEEIPDEVVTRLHLYGQDNISIQRVNPLGTSYVEDFSYYMTGFERDSNKNTLSSSINGMSDALCHALLDYKEVVQSSQGQFESLVLQSETLEEEKGQIEVDISLLDEQIKAEENVIDVKQTQDPQVDATVNLANLADLEAQMATKQSELATKNQQIIDNLTAIQAVKSSLQIDNSLSPELIQELDNYIFEETWEDANYTDDRLLYEDGIKVFMDKNKPKIVVTADIINLFKVLDKKAQLDSKKLVVGNRFLINYPEFDVNQESQLLELGIDFDGNSVSVQIANVADYENDDEELAKYLATAVSTGSTVDMSKYNWNSVNDVQTDVRKIIDDFRKGAQINIDASFDNNVQINNRGITTTSASDPLKGIRIINSTIGLSDDGFQTYKTALTSAGVVAERLIGRIVIAENLYLENQGGGKFRFDQDGSTLYNSSLNILGDGTAGDNGITLTPQNGLVVTKSDDKVKGIFNATEGMKFQVKVGTVWQDRFYYDVNNNRLVHNGEGNFSELKVQGSSVLTEANTRINGFFLGDNTVSSAKISSLTADKINTGTLTGITVEVTNAGMTNDNVGDTAVRIWAGNSYGLRNSAPFKVLQNGKVIASNIDILGGSINISNDIKVGDTIQIGEPMSSTTKLIRMRDSVSIYADQYDNLGFSTVGSIKLEPMNATFVYGQFDLTNATVVWGSNSPTARFG